MKLKNLLTHFKNRYNAHYKGNQIIIADNNKQTVTITVTKNQSYTPVTIHWLESKALDLQELELNILDTRKGEEQGMYQHTNIKNQPSGDMYLNAIHFVMLFLGKDMENSPLAR